MVHVYLYHIEIQSRVEEIYTYVFFSITYYNIEKDDGHVTLIIISVIDCVTYDWLTI